MLVKITPSIELGDTQTEQWEAELRQELNKRLGKEAGKYELQDFALSISLTGDFINTES